jgi:ferritin-like metal-binding protein YciE
MREIVPNSPCHAMEGLIEEGKEVCTAASETRSGASLN